MTPLSIVVTLNQEGQITLLGIHSDCRRSFDLEAFAKRHRETLHQALGLNFKRWPTDATFLYLYRSAAEA